MQNRPDRSRRSRRRCGFVATLQYVDRLFLVVMNMERGTTMRCDLDNKIVKRTAGIFARDFENQIATGS